MVVVVVVVGREKVGRMRVMRGVRRRMVLVVEGSMLFRSKVGGWGLE